jgi:GPH family glycoside/pentoside/hexuronide:cation symporter
MGFLQGIAISAIMPDICDLDEHRHGTRREGLFNAIVAALTKAEVAVAVLVAGSLINASGFLPAAGAQSPGTQLYLRIFGFGPFMICSLFSLYLATRFPLTESTTKLIQSELATRRAAGESPHCTP